MGVRDTPNVAASSISSSRIPGGYSPVTMSSSIESIRLSGNRLVGGSVMKSSIGDNKLIRHS